MKKYYEVSLTTSSVQTKYVLAETEEQAIEIAHDSDWCEKEEVLNTDIEAKEVEKKEIIGRYVETGEESIKVK